MSKTTHAERLSSDEKWRQDTNREKFNEWSDNMEELALLVDIKTQKKALSRFRKLNTQPENRWPNREAIYTLLNPIDFTKMGATCYTHKKDNPNHMDVQTYKTLLEYVCGWPQRYHDSYDDMYPPLDADGKPMMRPEEFKDYLIAQSHIDRQDSEWTQAEIPDQKKIDRMYKKYIKEWREKND